MMAGQFNGHWKAFCATPPITGCDVIEAEPETFERNGTRFRMWTPADHDPRGDRHTFPNRIITEPCLFCAQTRTLRAGTHGKEGFGL